MKKIAIFLFLCSLLVSCATTPAEPEPEFVYNITSENNSGIASLEATATWKATTFTSKAGIFGFGVTIKNNTDKVLRVVWEKSSVVYNNQSTMPFVSEQKYADASRPMSATVIPGKGSVGKLLFSSSQIQYGGSYLGWTILPINSKEATIILCIQSGDIEDYYSIRVSAI